MGDRIKWLLRDWPLKVLLIPFYGIVIALGAWWLDALGPMPWYGTLAICSVYLAVAAYLVLATIAVFDS